MTPLLPAAGTAFGCARCLGHWKGYLGWWGDVVGVHGQRGAWAVWEAGVPLSTLWG